MIEESEVDEVVIEEGDLKITVRKAGVGAGGRSRAAGAGRPAGSRRHRRRRRGANGYHLVKLQVGRHVLPLALAAVAGVRRGRRPGRGRSDALHPRDDEDDERAARPTSSGVVREILVENGETVQYGQPLFAIEPA